MYLWIHICEYIFTNPWFLPLENSLNPNSGCPFYVTSTYTVSTMSQLLSQTIVSLLSYNNPMKWILLCPFNRWRYWSPEKISHLSRVTQRVSHTTIWMQEAGLWSRLCYLGVTWGLQAGMAESHCSYWTLSMFELESFSCKTSRSDWFFQEINVSYIKTTWF